MASRWRRGHDPAATGPGVALGRRLDDAAGGRQASLTHITHVIRSARARIQTPRQEKVEWKGADGQTIEGMLMYPVGYQQGMRYPPVVQMHGGPFISLLLGRWIGVSR